VVEKPQLQREKALAPGSALTYEGFPVPKKRPVLGRNAFPALHTFF
jgi:hypothetical protein